MCMHSCGEKWREKEKRWSDDELILTEPITKQTSHDLVKYKKQEM